MHMSLGGGRGVGGHKAAQEDPVIHVHLADVYLDGLCLLPSDDSQGELVHLAGAGRRQCHRIDYLPQHPRDQRVGLLRQLGDSVGRSLGNILIIHSHSLQLRSGGNVALLCAGLLGAVSLAGLLGVSELQRVGVLSERLVNCNLELALRSIAAIECLDGKKVKCSRNQLLAGRQHSVQHKLPLPLVVQLLDCEVSHVLDVLLVRGGSLYATESNTGGLLLQQPEG
mmetsp:Transcript_5061/g.14135  ORF Transcript_5061/g.14135 Transcript_5061/m.14135 type:complete len:225 (+) Transcript_5061:109-783(+)